MKNKNITLFNIFRRYKLKVSITFIMALSESAIFLFFPLFIGFAINDIIKSDYSGLINLGLLGVASLIAGAIRRFYDTRIYAKVYEEISTELVKKERKIKYRFPKQMPE